MLWCVLLGFKRLEKYEDDRNEASTVEPGAGGTLVAVRSSMSCINVDSGEFHHGWSETWKCYGHFALEVSMCRCFLSELVNSQTSLRRAKTAATQPPKTVQSKQACSSSSSSKVVGFSGTRMVGTVMEKLCSVKGGCVKKEEDHEVML